MKKVVKFGGSSLASAEQFKKVGDIIRSVKVVKKAVKPQLRIQSRRDVDNEEK